MGPDHSLAKQQAQPAGPLGISVQACCITLLPQGTRFDCALTLSVLSAAHAANILMPYSCRGGRCGSCRGRVLEGEVDYPAGIPEALSRAEMEAGFALFCSAHPLTDLTIELAQPEATEASSADSA